MTTQALAAPAHGDDRDVGQAAVRSHHFVKRIEARGVEAWNGLRLHFVESFTRFGETEAARFCFVGSRVPS